MRHAEAAMWLPEEASGMPILLKDDMYMLYNRSFKNNSENKPSNPQSQFDRYEYGHSIPSIE